MIYIFPSKPQDIDLILANLREHEQRSIERLGIDARAILLDAVKNNSLSFSAFVDAEIACMWGLTSTTLIGGNQKLWMLTTPLVEKHSITFLRLSRQFVQKARALYGPIDGAVFEDYEISYRWLRWIGFKEIEDGPIKKMRYG